jgi:LysM repeat protein
MTLNPRAPARICLAGMLVLVFAITLPGCDRSRTQVLLKRGAPEATPSSAPLVITPLVPSLSPTPEETRPATATATTQPSSTQVVPTRTAAPTATLTATPTVAPTMTPTVAPTVAPTSTPSPAATATPQVRVHVVRAGETLAIIARRYTTTATAIARYNGLSNPNRIYVGQRLLIP